MKIAVIGTGIIGLSSAIRLLEAGHEVTIISRDLPENTTSAVAAAYWHPSGMPPSERVVKWALNAAAVYKDWSQNNSLESGIFYFPFIEYFDAPKPEPWWKGGWENFAFISQEKLPKGIACAYSAQLAVIDVSVHYPFLSKLFFEKKGKFIQRNLSSISEIENDFDLIINCSGVWAKDLAPDPSVYPVRGQVVRLEKQAHLQTIIRYHGDENLSTYVVPRRHDCILGGTKQINDDNLQVEENDSKGIIERCSHFFPELKKAKILEHRVALRPGRKEIRLEIEKSVSGKPLIHNYGHGGAGWTLSWGCADEVVELATKILK